MDDWKDSECYYVSVTDAGKVGLLSGAYQTHEEALEKVDAAKERAYKVDPQSWFYAYGTVKMKNGHCKTVFGTL